MKKFFLLLSIFIFTGCISVGIPIGPFAYIGVSADENGISPSLGVSKGGVGVSVNENGVNSSVGTSAGNIHVNLAE
jgi:hypothetical protein